MYVIISLFYLVGPKENLLYSLKLQTPLEKQIANTQIPHLQQENRKPFGLSLNFPENLQNRRLAHTGT
jgi:hypothetical protein